LTNENIFLKDEVENLRYNLNNLTEKYNKLKKEKENLEKLLNNLGGKNV